MSGRPRLRRACFATLTAFVGLLLLEILLRLMVEPSTKSYGVFLGQELPPLKLIPYAAAQPKTDRDAWHAGLMVDGERISIGDLWGFQREDADLGYAPKENMTSLNGWWQSNNIGARERHDTSARRPPGKRRALVFGDSYAQGSRVKQEEAWPYQLERESDALDVVNLGADGYSMAQSYLRYRQLKREVEYDLVVLVFVPIKDLWRDINTVRSLAKDWDYYVVLPRFVIERDRLVLAASPYERASRVFEENGVVASAELKAHLSKYDRFYFEAEFREPRFAGRSVLYKIGLRAYLLYRKRALYRRLDPQGEAMQVTRRIFWAMDDEVRREGGRFVLVFLPSLRDLDSLRASARYAANWKRMVDATCGEPISCIDLSPAFLDAPPDRLDRGYDGSHYGPRANRLTAESIRQALSDTARLPTGGSGSAGGAVGD